MSGANHVLLVQIGKRIRLLRKRKGWTQIDMAVAHGHESRSHIGHRTWEARGGDHHFASDREGTRNHDVGIAEATIGLA